MKLEDKSVFITGAARGLGRAVLVKLLERNARVLFCDIKKTEGQRTVNELRHQFPGCDVTFVECDVGDTARLTEVFKEAVSRFGSLDVCINNAGFCDERLWQRMIAVNQVGMIHGSLLALEHMRQDKGGRGGVIINNASVNGLYYGRSDMPVYTSTKRAVVGFTTGWANSPEQPLHGVRWGLVCPGGVLTDIQSVKSLSVYGQTDLEGRTYPPQLTPEGRSFMEKEFLTAEEASEAFMTLLADDESNGDIIKIYGDQKEDKAVVTMETLELDQSTVPVTALKMKRVKVTPR